MSKLNKTKLYARQNGSSFYRKTIRINNEKIEKVFSRKVDAEKWYQDKKREKELLENGMSLPSTDLTLQAYALDWLEKRRLAGKPLGSWESDEGRLRKYILPQFGHREFNRISTKEWEIFLDSLVADQLVSSATRNRIRSLATKMYNDGIRQEVASQNPVRVIPKLKESMEAWDYWPSTDDIMAYLTEAKKESEWFYLFACLSLNLGIRIGETLALDHEDINLSQRRIHISKVFEETSGKIFKRTKGHKERWLGINDSLFESLIESKNNSNFQKSNHAVICDSNGVRLYERHVRRVHDRICIQAKIKPIRIHDLRHTYASHYIMNGGTISELQSLLGHSSPMMTLKYMHLAPGYLEKKAEIVSFSLGNQNNITPLRRVK
jgi:integrase